MNRQMQWLCGAIGLLLGAACSSARPGISTPAGSPVAWSCPDRTVARTRDTVLGTEAWCERPDGPRQGPYAWTYPHGITAERTSYVDGRLDGPFASWHAGGGRRAEGQYQAGVRVGHWREWHGNGKLWLDVTYVAGKAEGRWLEYDATGTLMFEGTYRASRLDGGWHAYRPGDQVLASGTSSDGRLEGALRYATRDGGGRWEKGYLDNRPHGTWKYFVEERLVYEMTYRHGFLHGPMTEYDQAGAVVGAWEYRDGELVTTTPAADEAPRD